MDVASATGLLLLGLLLLAVGGELLVRAATTLAELAGVTPAVIGLTVVAIGTSIPELVVSLLAGWRGQPDLATANVVGSNIFNIAATLGITALVVPLPVHGSAVRLEWPVMFVATLMSVLVARDGTIDRVEGGVFLIALVLFVAYSLRVARRDVGAAEARQLAEHVEARDLDVRLAPLRARRASFLVSAAILAAGITALVAGGRLLVSNAVDLARLAGISERVIGLTIVAGGTGAPELATSLVAALRQRTDVAVANMVGSNIVNLLGILGITALVTPLPVSAALLRSDVWWMVGTAALLLPVMRSEGRISRLEGAVLVGAYAAYLVTLLSAPGK
jgi:cation:H+ antiporter